MIDKFHLSGIPKYSRKTPPAAVFLLLTVAGLVVFFLPQTLLIGLLVLIPIVLLILRAPLFGLSLALLLGPFGALEAIILGPTILDSGQIVLLFTFFVWLLTGFARRRVTIPNTRLNLPLLLFIFVGLLTLLDTRDVSLGIIELVKWIEILLIIWLVVDLSADPERHPYSKVAAVRWVVASLLVAGLVQAVIGIWQFALRGDGPEHFAILGGFYRAYGTFEQPNPFGGYINLTVFLAAGVFIGAIALLWQRRNGIARGFSQDGRLFICLLFAFVCTVAATLALIFSWSRGAWLGLIAGCVVLLLFSTKRFHTGLLLTLGLAAILFFGILLGISAGFGPARSLAERLGGFREELIFGDVRGVDINDTNYAVLERLAHWQAALDMARDDLWTGVGFGNYETAYAEYALINWPSALGHAHNYYLNLLAEIGMPGLMAYLLFWLVVIRQTVQVIRVSAWPERGVAVGLLAAWVALAVHHLVDKLYVNNIYIHLGVMLSLLQLLVWPGIRGNPDIDPLVNHSQKLPSRDDQNDRFVC